MRASLPTVLVACAGCAAGALGAPTAIIQTTGVGANAFVDGLQFKSIDRPNKSGTGDYWVLLARNTGGTSSDAMVITGQGLSYNLAAQEGVSLFDGRTFSTSDRYIDINASGDWVAIGNHADGASTDDEAVYAGDYLGTSLFVAAAEGQVSGAGPTYGTGNYGPGITDGGQYSYGYSDAANSSNINYFTDSGGTVVLTAGDVPTGQRGGTAFALETPFSGRNAFQVSSDGSSYLAAGELSNGDAVLIKDGAVVLQEGDTIYGAETLTAFRHEQNLLQDNGDWYQRGATDTGRGVAIRNGAVLAASGELVGGNLSGEVWDDSVWTSSSGTTFFQVTGDNSGNFVIGGFTDNADADRNAVWMYNGVSEILRAGDQIDLDGDGGLDDAFVYFSSLTTASPSPLGGFLADDGWFYTLVDVRNAAGTDLGEAFIAVQVPAPGAAGVLVLGGLLATRRRR